MEKFTVKQLMLGLLISMGMLISPLHAQIGIFEKSEDIGNPAIKGSSAYDPTTQVYTLKGGGSNIWFNHDEFHFLYKKIKGDFCLTANFELIGNTDGNGHRKTGWMIRESTDHDAVSINTCLHGDGLVVIQWRPLRGAYMRDPEEEIFFPKKYFGENIIQLERVGKKITMRIAHPGENLIDMGSFVLPELKDEVLIGPYSLAHDPEDLQEARVWNVRITTPVAAEWHPNRLVRLNSNKDLKLSSRLEVLNISDGSRRLIYESKDAPITGAMFAVDGNKLIFSQDNKSFEISLKGGKPVPRTNKIDAGLTSDGTFEYYNDDTTGTQQIWRKSKDNKLRQQLTFDNEHKWFPQISPDKKWLSYLAYPPDVNPVEAVNNQQVMIKLMSLSGGAPRTIAYLFGGKSSMGNWSSDGKQMVFVSSGEVVK